MEAHQHECQNCGATLISAYCHDCGQKADTHRITLSHLIKHDLVHGIWHFDKGLLFTLREAFMRPGYMAMDYIKGRRIKYYNVFYLILMVLGANFLVANYLKHIYDITEKASPKGIVLHENSVDISYFFKTYFKQFLFLMIPLFALSGYISFRKLKLNFAEHSIIAGSLLLSGALWYFFVIVGMYTSYTFESDIYNFIVWGFAIVVCLQPVRVYYQVAIKKYTKMGFLLRALQWYGNIALFLYLVLLIIALYTGKKSITLN